MKKYFYLAIAAVVSVAFASCGGNDPEHKGDKKAAHTITIGEVTATTADITVTPKDAAAPYVWTIFDKAAVEETFGSNMDSVAIEFLAMMQEQFDGYIEDMGAEGLAEYGITDVPSMLEYFGYLVTGTDTYTYTDLAPETAYLVLAFNYDAANNAPCSKVATAEFTTPAVPRSTNKLTINVNPTTYMATITTTNNDPYFVYVETTSDYLQYNPDYTEAALAASINDWVALYQMYGFGLDVMEGIFYFQGNQTLDLAGEYMTAEDASGNYVPAYGEYIIYAAPYNAGVNGAAVYALVNYTASAAAPAAAPAVRFDVKKADTDKFNLGRRASIK